MSRHAARARRWMLWAAPFMALCGLRWGVGGAALGLALWLGLGALIPSVSVYPYPRKHRPIFHRLFLGFSVCVFLLGGLYAAALRFFLDQQKTDDMNDWLFLLGAIGFSLPIGQKVMFLSLPRKLSWAIAMLLSFLFVLFIIIE